MSSEGAQSHGHGRSLFGGAESRSDVPESEAGSGTFTGVIYVRHPYGGLPLALTSLVGRERDVGEVARMLEEKRLLTMYGPGGSGKTRLAMAAAKEAAEGPLDGAWWGSGLRRLPILLRCPWR